MPPTFTHLVMSGGGFSALVYFGALRFLQVEGLYDSIRNVCGTSMGAVIATAIALRIPLEVLEHRLCALMSDQERNNIAYPDVMRCLSELGMDDMKQYIHVLRPEIDQLTFLQLSKKTGIHLVICATHIPSFEPTYFSVDATPHVLVADAVRASAAVPWVFKPVRIGTDLFVDGGVSDNVPIKPFHDVPRNSVVVLHVTGKPPQIDQIDPISYTIALTTRYASQATHASYLQGMFPFYIPFKDPPLPFMSVTFQPDNIRMKLTKEDLDASIASGYETAFHTLRPFMQKDSSQKQEER